MPWICDVRDEDQVAATAQAAHERWGAPDILIANAGINPMADDSTTITPELWNRVMDVNVAGIFWCCKHVAPFMRKRRRGSIVALASVSGLIGWGGSAAYVASKGAVIALTRALAMEYAPERVRVNCLCPGSIWTPMVEVQFRDLPDREERLQRTAALHPLGRIGTAEDVAWGALYLASDESSFVTGTALVIDGGLTAR
jgi:NAD(P)-dependent dehydrogenase (short-subunit alcohol dehydrogenase family)